MQNFDPNAAAPRESGVFGLPFREEEAALVYLPVPWEATTSYGGGTSRGPEAILRASHQVDLFDLDVLKPYEAGLFMLPESAEVRSWNERGRLQAKKVIEVAGVTEGNPELKSALAEVNELGERLNHYVLRETRALLARGQIPAIVGGDHSVPFGAIQAMAERTCSFGILHFDAHSDTRDAYEGFRWSHASIMRNVLEYVPEVKKLVQVGIRDVCEQEMDYTRAQGNRMKVFFDRDIQRRRFEGRSWRETCREIIESLPENVWISFDIDGLDPRFCPHTGTPVAGGLDISEASYLVGLLARSDKKIIGFDLNEVAPSGNEGDEWDANVGARLLYKLTGWTLGSQGKAKFREDY